MNKKFIPQIIVLIFAAIFIYLPSAISQTSNIADLLHFTAVARDMSGQSIANTDISVKIQIYTGDPTQGGSTLEYCETGDEMTNGFGEFSLEFGPNPSSICDPFKFLKDVPWQTGNKYVKIGFREGNSGPYTDIASFKLTTVPYAFAARTAEQLANFNLTGATNGQVIKFDQSSGTWKTGIDELGIVSANTPEQGHVLMFDNGQWKSTTLKPDIAIFEEQKNPGVDWSGTEGTYTKRALNIEVLASPSVDLNANNEIVFVKGGIYLITGSAYAYDKGNHKLVIRHKDPNPPGNITIILEGTTEYNSDQVSDVSNRTFIMGTISVPPGTSPGTPYICTLDHYSSIFNQGTFGNGINAPGSTHETYSQIMIQKIE